MINQPTIIITAILVILTFIVQRKYFFLPFIIAAVFIPADQRIIIFSLDFTPLRILIIAGGLRILIREERLTFKLNRFDKLVFIWALCGAVIYVLQWLNLRAIIYKSGVLFDVIGLYWLFRINIQSWDDVNTVTLVFAICLLFLAPLVAIEWTTGKNPFFALGRVRTWLRAGRYRCQASFPHAIMLGLFCANLLPLFIGVAWQSKKKILLWSASVVSIFIVLATASSTPLLTLLIIIVGLCGYKLRKYTSLISKVLVLVLLALHIVMEAPVWHLISRINAVGGSTGWHRYHLIDEAIDHFSEWAILGCRSTAHWGFMLDDVTNHYIYEAVLGGLLTLVLFLTMIFIALKTLLHFSLECKEEKQCFQSWCLFIALVGHCTAFLGVSYFGQIQTLWYMMIAIVGLLYEGLKHSDSFVLICSVPNRRSIFSVLK